MEGTYRASLKAGPHLWTSVEVTTMVLMATTTTLKLFNLLPNSKKPEGLKRQFTTQ